MILVGMRGQTLLTAIICTLQRQSGVHVLQGVSEDEKRQRWDGDNNNIAKHYRYLWEFDP